MPFDRKAYQQAYYQAHKEKCNALTRAWRKKNPERARMHSYNNFLRRKAQGLKEGHSKEANESYYQANKEALKVARHLGVSVKVARELLKGKPCKTPIASANSQIV